MRLSLSIFLLILFFLIEPKKSFAACECMCVDGEKVPICESALDIPPPCFGVCSIPPPKIPPIGDLRIPPIGTKKCEQRQVMNPNTRVYEWRTVCQ